MQGRSRRIMGHNPSGHNYDLYLTVGGPVDSETGMVVNLQDLDSYVERTVLERFDHRDVTQDYSHAFTQAAR